MRLGDEGAIMPSTSPANAAVNHPMDFIFGTGSEQSVGLCFGPRTLAVADMTSIL